MEKFKNGLKWFLKSFIWLFILGIGVDILSKNIIVNTMTLDQKIILIPNFLAIHYTVNNGAAFSMGVGNNVANMIIYIVIAGLASAGIIFYFVKNEKKMSKLLKAPLMLILAGALGNMIDRIFYAESYTGASYRGVVDFIDFFGIWNAIFNVADICIVVGAILMIVYIIVEEVKERKTKPKQKVVVEKQVSKTEKEMQIEKDTDK